MAAAPEARYCRRCGTHLQRVTNAHASNDEFVSPQAATIPLSEDGRATNGLGQDELGRPNAETNRVNRAELDDLLRTVRQEHAFDAPAAPATPEENQTSSPTTRAGEFNLPPEAFNGSVTQPSLRALPFQADGGGETRAVSSEEFDDEVTITVARQEAAPRQVVRLQAVEAPPLTPLPEEGQGADALGAPADEGHAAPAPAPPRRTHKIWYGLAAVSVSLLLLMVVGLWLGSRPTETPSPTNGNNVSPASNPRQMAEEKMTEAEALLASGDLEAAIGRLREATSIDPSNAGARRRLADLLLNQGRRREAIEEYRAIVRNDARDAEAWRALARAQLDESLFADAAESFRQLVALGGEATINDNERLSYAEALRLSGRAREAQSFYQKLVASEVVDVANTARQRLSEISAATASPMPDASPDAAHNAHEQSEQARNAQNAPTPSAVSTPPALSAPTPAPQRSATPEAQSSSSLSASDHFKRGEQMWWSNRGAALEEFRASAAKGNRDAYYYLGLSIAEGKDPRTLNRALLGAAFQYFQNAARGGRFRNEARRYEQQLGEELDRRRGSSQ